MKTITMKKIMFMIFFLLSLIYIGLLVGMIKMHYNELSSIQNTNIFNTMEQYNWKYWFENEDNKQTIFSSFLQYIDIHYLHSEGIIPIIINISFIFFFIALIVIIIGNLFYSMDNNTSFIQAILIFFIVILLFSSIQDSSIVWFFNQQLFAAYFFPLLSYYLLVKFSITKSDKYFYILLWSGVMILITTPHYFSALFVLLLISFKFKIGRYKNLFFSFFIFLPFFFYYDEILNSITILNQYSGNKILLYVLNYLGSFLVYMSFEPCIATSSVIGGIIILSTFIYFSCLVVSKKVTEQFYTVILAYLFFYILTAFGTLIEMKDEHIIFFKNQYMTPSLISLALVFILYIHYFNTIQTAKRRILILFTTLITILFFNQIFTYREYEKNISELRLAITSLKLGIEDKRYLQSFIRHIYTMMYCPINGSKKKISMFAFNNIRTQAIQNKIHFLKEKNLFNININNLSIENELDTKSHKESLIGNIDRFLSIDKKRNIIQIHGWVYDLKDKKVPTWLIVTDEDKTPIGYVATGISRIDIEKIHGKSSIKSGFYGYIKYVSTPKKLFLIDKLGKKLLLQYNPKLLFFSVMK